MRRAAPIALAALAVAAGCGGGDSDDGEGAEAPTNDALACVQDEGLKAIATGGDEPLGITGGLRVSLPPGNRITVDFFDDPERAAEYSAGQSAFLGAAGGSSEVVGETAVVGVQRAGAGEELARVKGCID
jgi:hypothetical protein